MIGSRDLRLTCLVYHRLHADGEGLPAELEAFSIGVSRFKEHLRALSNANYTAVTPDEIFSWQQGKSRPAHPLLISFDDGWASNIFLAARELQRRNMPWVIFVTADRTSDFFQEGGSIDRALKDEEIMQLAEQGVTIGSHGISHRPFTEMSTYDLCFELVESRRQLEALTNKTVDWLAAPYGLSNRKVQKAVRMAGYRAYASGLAGDTQITYDNMVILRRIAARPHWTGEQLTAALAPRAVAASARKTNLKRAFRLMLGYERSKRLRRFIKEKLHARRR